MLVYVVAMLVLGLPLVFFEMGLGQFCQEGPTKIWRAVPILKGVGFVKIIVSIFTAVYYPLMMTMSLFFVVWTAKGPYPFSECGNESGEDCLRDSFLTPFTSDLTWFGVNAAFLFFLWAVCLLSIFKHKYSYRVTAPLFLLIICVILIALLFETFSTISIENGLQEFYTFKWDELRNFKIWYFAVIQVLFSTQIGFGNITTCAGKLYPKSNTFISALFYILTNLLLGISAVLLVYLWAAKVRVSKVIQSPDVLLMTLVYDAGQSYLPFTQLWPALAFIAFTLSGFCSMCAVLYTIISGIIFETGKDWLWWHVAGFSCIIGFLIGVPCLLLNNFEVTHILDHYVIGRTALATIALELIGFLWIYGSKNIYNDFEFVMGCKLTPIWKIIWIIAPIILIALEIASVVLLPVTGSGAKDDDIWIYVTGWGLYLAIWLIIIGTAVYQVSSQVGYNLKQKLSSALKSTRNWGPKDTLYTVQWVRWKDYSNKGGEKDFTLRRQGTKDYTSSIKKGTHSFSINRTASKGPYSIESNSQLQEHVCWRGNKS